MPSHKHSFVATTAQRAPPFAPPSLHTADHEFDLAGHLKWIKYTNAANAPLLSNTYTVDDIHRRTKVEREDGSWWDWGYNARSEVASASRKFADGTAVPMEQFSYSFDDIGNRFASAAAGRQRSYTANALNQYTARANPGFLPISGEAHATANVVVNAQRAERKGGLFWAELPVENSSGGVFQKIDALAAKPHAGVGAADLVGKESGAQFVPPAQESLQYDADGNLAADGRWTYAWDAENRLASMEERANPTMAAAGLARHRLEFTYDAFSRRATRRVSTWDDASSQWVLQARTVFIWDGWNLVAELDASPSVPVSESPRLLRTYVWGLDIAGSLSATGGIGALVFETLYSTTVNNGQPLQTGLLAPCYDGNGNVLGLMNMATGALDARYEYDAFGNVLRSTGPAANANLVRFSTKYLDELTGLYNYGLRDYSAELGRWLCADPIAEMGGVNLYGMCRNDPVNYTDYLGLWKQFDKKLAKTTFEAEKGDIIKTLAAKRGLKSSEYKEWLTVDSGAMPKSETEDICPGAKFKVPNTVIAYWAGEGGMLGRAWTLWGAKIGALKRKDYLVDERRHSKKSTPAYELQGLINQKTQDRTLHGLYFWGHGSSDGSLYKDRVGEHPCVDIPSLDLSYHLPLTWIYSCYGGRAIDEIGTGDGDERGNADGTLVPIYPGGGIDMGH